MTDLDELVDTLLFEGYALYPYTPGATKNATPTPFGIVYPPAYARGSGATHDRLRIECRLDGGRRASRATVRCLRRPASATRAPAGGSTSTVPGEVAFDFGGVPGARGSSSTATAWRCGCATRPRSPEGLDRDGRAARTACSPPTWSRTCAAGASSRRWRRTDCEQVNTWPVLAIDADDAVLGAAIMLPDHPQLAPESRGSLFDSTEIEEALLLHVLALSDDERAATAEQDPAVRAMIERAARADARGAHGPARPRDGRRARRGAWRGRGDGRRRHLPARRHGAAAPGAGPQRARPPDDRPRRRRSSASTSTTTAACSSRSRSTTSPART